MTASSSEAEKNVWKTINEFSDQLNGTFKSNKIIQDYALLSGFLSFVHSKLVRLIMEILEEQQLLFKESKGTESYIGDMEVDDKSLPLILRLYWEKIAYPIFKWFQLWRKMLLPKKSKEQPKYVEFRRMNTKLTKFFKSVHKFYYTVIETLFSRYDLSEVIPKEILTDICNSPKYLEGVEVLKLDSRGRFTILIVVTLNCCLLYLGSAQRYKSLGEKLSNKYSSQDFKKSFRYLNLASLILPSIGESHLQKGMIYIQTDNLGSAVYEFTRSALSRIPSPAGLTNFATIICQRDSNLHQKFDSILRETHLQEIEGTKIINREIIEYYFLALFGAHFAPHVWIDPNDKGSLLDHDNMGIDRLKEVMLHRIRTRYLKNVETIFRSLITVIGGYDLLLIVLNGPEGVAFDIKSVNLKDLDESVVSYLKFAFGFITQVFNTVIRDCWQKNLETYHYLAMVRIVECWIKSNRAVLQFSHRNEEFCRSLSQLLNDINKSKLVEVSPATSHRPKRNYFFPEDLDLKEFSCVKYALTDFNDEEIYKSKNVPSRISNMPPVEDKLPAGEEGKLRLKAIVSAGVKFLAKNSCGIIWNAQNKKYEYHSKNPATGKPLSVSIRRRSFSLSSNPPTKVMSVTESVSMSELEEQLTRRNKESIANRQVNASKNSKDIKNCDSRNSGWGYSGSSTPMAPVSLSIKPSSTLTHPVSPRNLASEGADFNNVFTGGLPAQTSISSDSSTVGSTIQTPNLSIVTPAYPYQMYPGGLSAASFAPLEQQQQQSFVPQYPFMPVSAPPARFGLQDMQARVPYSQRQDPAFFSSNPSFPMSVNRQGMYLGKRSFPYGPKNGAGSDGYTMF